MAVPGPGMGILQFLNENAGAAQVVLTGALVLVTVFYVRLTRDLAEQAKRQADEAAAQAEEARRVASEEVAIVARELLPDLRRVRRRANSLGRTGLLNARQAGRWDSLARAGAQAPVPIRKGAQEAVKALHEWHTASRSRRVRPRGPSAQDEERSAQAHAAAGRAKEALERCLRFHGEETESP